VNGISFRNSHSARHLHSSGDSGNQKLMSNLGSLRRILSYAKASDNVYAGTPYEAGYQTLRIDGVELKGQRDPVQRLSNIEFDFRSKSVLDIGSNQGGMLFPIAGQIANGMGVDFNSKLVNTANKLARHSGYDNLDFYVFDLESDPLSLLNDFARSTRFDMIFFLSVSMWIKNWKEVLGWIRMNSDACLFESNGKPRQQAEQEDELRLLFSKVKLINERSSDDELQSKRRLFMCTA
jgi:SAM-dependent methyltransferase